MSKSRIDISPQIKRLATSQLLLLVLILHFVLLKHIINLYFSLMGISPGKDSTIAGGSGLIRYIVLSLQIVFVTLKYEETINKLTYTCGYNHVSNSFVWMSALRRAGLVLTFRAIYSARLQEKFVFASKYLSAFLFKVSKNYATQLLWACGTNKRC